MRCSLRFLLLPTLLNLAAAIDCFTEEFQSVRNLTQCSSSAFCVYALASKLSYIDSITHALPEEDDRSIVIRACENDFLNGMNEAFLNQFGQMQQPEFLPCGKIVVEGTTTIKYTFTLIDSESKTSGNTANKSQMDSKKVKTLYTIYQVCCWDEGCNQRFPLFDVQKTRQIRLVEAQYTLLTDEKVSTMRTTIDSQYDYLLYVFLVFGLIIMGVLLLSVAVVVFTEEMSLLRKTTNEVLDLVHSDDTGIDWIELRADSRHITGQIDLDELTQICMSIERPKPSVQRAMYGTGADATGTGGGTGAGDGTGTGTAGAFSGTGADNDLPKEKKPNLKQKKKRTITVTTSAKVPKRQGAGKDASVVSAVNDRRRTKSRIGQVKQGNEKKAPRFQFVKQTFHTLRTPFSLPVREHAYYPPFDEYLWRIFAHGPYKFEHQPIDLVEIFDQARTYFAADPNLLHVKAPMIVIGDIRGQYQDLFRWMEIAHFRGGVTRLLFTGNVIDSKMQGSLDCLAFVAALKLKFPTDVFMLRGSEEMKGLKLPKKRYPDEGNTYVIEHSARRMLSVLPLVAIIGRKVMVVHSGISHIMNDARNIKTIERPYGEYLGYARTPEVAQRVITNEPSIDVRYYRPKRDCDTIDNFGELAVERVLRDCKLQMIIRSHNPIRSGFASMFSGRLLSIWSNLSREDCRSGSIISFDSGMKICCITQLVCTSVINVQLPKIVKSEPWLTKANFDNTQRDESRSGKEHRSDKTHETHEDKEKHTEG